MLLLILLLMYRPVKRLGRLSAPTRGLPAGPEAAAEETAPARFYSRGRLPPGRRRKVGTRSAAQGPSRGEPFLVTFWGVCQKVTRRKGETASRAATPLDMYSN